MYVNGSALTGQYGIWLSTRRRQVYSFSAYSGQYTEFKHLQTSTTY